MGYTARMRICRSFIAALPIFAFVAAGCSSSEEGNPPIPVPESGAPDVTSDADASPDTMAPPDALPDATPGTDADASMDASPEAEPDTGPDEGVDSPADAPTDAGPSSVDCDKLKKLDTDLSAASNATQKLALVDAFMTEVEASDGFPIRCAGEVSFFFKAPNGFGTPPHVAGDFNGWDATKDAMTQIAGSAWRATLAVAQGPNRFMYKFTDGTHWMADVRARRFGFDSNGEYSLVSGGTLKGHLERYPAIGGAGLQARPLSLYIPPGYEAGSQSFPVLYAHDGQNLFDPSAMWGSWKLDAAIEGLLGTSTVQPFLVVGIHNTSDRMDEYTQVQDDIGSGPLVGGKADQYYQLIHDTIMPLIAQHYRVKTGPENTWTMGSSLGGLVSLYFGMKYPTTFGRVAGLSSTAGWGSIGATIHNQTIIELLPTLNKPPVVFYLDSGGGPGNAPGCVDSDNDGIDDDGPNATDNYCETAQMRDVFAAAGYVYDVDLVHWWESGAEHNEAAWAARVFRPLTVLGKP